MTVRRPVLGGPRGARHLHLGGRGSEKKSGTAGFGGEPLIMPNGIEEKTRELLVSFPGALNADENPEPADLRLGKKSSQQRQGRGKPLTRGKDMGNPMKKYNSTNNELS